MGLWIRLEEQSGADLDLESARTLLSKFPGVEAREPSILKGFQSYSLRGLGGGPTKSAPIVEISPKAFVVALNWADTLDGHASWLTRTLLETNQVKGQCYDGYHHRDNEAVQKFLKFAGLNCWERSPDCFRGFLEERLLGKRMSGEIVDEVDLEFDFGEAKLRCDLKDWDGPTIGSELSGIEVSWESELKFLFDGLEARLSAKRSEWELCDAQGEVLLVGEPRRGLFFHNPD